MREEPSNKAKQGFAWNVRDDVRFVRDNPSKFHPGFAEWLERNAEVWARFKVEADRIRRRRRHYSATTIIGYLRHETALADDDAEYKINNNATGDMARLYLARSPNAEGFFELRQTRVGG